MDTLADASEVPGPRLVARTTLLGVLVATGSNTLSVVAVVLLLTLVVPLPPGSDLFTTPVVVTTIAYVVCGLLLGVSVGVRAARSRMGWLTEGRPARAEDRDRVTRLPAIIARLQASLWIVAAIVFWALLLAQSWLLAVEVGFTVFTGGVASSASSFLAVEVVNRPVVARALADAPLETPRGAGVTSRALLLWLYGTAVPLLGVALFGALNIGTEVDPRRLAVWVLVVALLTMATSLVVTVLAARSIAHPLKALRLAVRRLDRGERDVQVPVTDHGDFGLLQLAFNQFAGGLAERDRLRELFGRHVGEQVARRAITEGVELGGELREVAVLFVDVAGSTALARELDPHAFVERLNRVFAAAVSSVEEEGGTVTNFAGDAAVAVWGAPVLHPAPAAAALLAARTLAGRLADDPLALPAGIGVATGMVVAGNIGTDDRLEYTVIGDAVNVAARLSDEAKSRSVPVLADHELLLLAGEEAANWEDAGAVVLRGRPGTTRTVTARAR